MNRKPQSNLELSTQDIDAVNTTLQQESSSEIIRLSHQQPPREIMLSEYQGDRIEKKSETTIRLCHINIRGVTHTKDNPKNYHIKEVIDLYEFDHIGLIETNCNW